MASSSYPMMSATNWWKIRKKFNQTLPGVVTPSYLASILDMQEGSASNNIMPYLKQTGIIDAEGKTSERAKLWRENVDYPKVCDAIRKEIYPSELLDIPIANKEDTESVRRWFARTTGAGASSVNKMVLFYLLLVEKDPSKQPDEKNPASKPEKPKTKLNGSSGERAKTVIVGKVNVPSTSTNANPAPQTTSVQASPLAAPTININLQIHISADASADQIDKMFKSMYKHIYSKKADLNG